MERHQGMAVGMMARHTSPGEGERRAIGWKPGIGGLFRWEDDSGQVIVETVLWGDGVGFRGRENGDEVGEGWLVLGSSSAIAQMRVRFPTLIRVIVAERSYSGQATGNLKRRRLAREVLETGQG